MFTNASLMESNKKETTLKGDLLLIEELRKGKRMRFNDFYRKERGGFLSWATSQHQLNRAEATDIYQSAMVVLYQNIVKGKLQNLSSSLRTYVYGIAKRLILRFFRQQKKRYHRQELVKRYLEEEQREMPRFMGEDEPAYKSQQELLQRIIRNLGDTCKQLLQLFYFENLRLKEIANYLDYKTPDVVKTQKSRCMKRLKQKVQAHLHSTEKDES